MDWMRGKMIEFNVTHTLKRLCYYVVLIVVAFIMLAPFLWVISTSLKPDSEVFALPLRWIPKTLKPSNYLEVMKVGHFPRYLLNSFIVATARMILQLFLASLAGYTLARLKFPGRNLIFLLIIATIMIPFEVLVIPAFVIIKRMPLIGGNNIFGYGGTGLMDTYWGLILPGAVTPIAVFLCRQFFISLPSYLEDAARIDGCSEFGIYFKIMLPLSKPILSVLAVISFTAGWNDFLWPLVIIRSEKMKTIQLALSVFQVRYFINWRLLMAAVVISIIPMFLLYLYALKYFTKGITFTGSRE